MSGGQVMDIIISFMLFTKGYVRKYRAELCYLLLFLVPLGMTFLWAVATNFWDMFWGVLGLYSMVVSCAAFVASMVYMFKRAGL